MIVYAPTIASVESTVDLLEENGIPSIGYHGQMNAADRRRNQERWMADEVRVMVGTIAFGLGINKATVRAVIHLSLPKSIEQYYQEAGRGGRDGLPADCVMLWQKKDAGLHAYFIGQINDPDEKRRAWQRYDEIRGFVESDVCRHQRICGHFGENKKWESCGACDVCGYEPDWLSAPVKEAPRRGKRSKSRTAAPAPITATRSWERPAPSMPAARAQDAAEVDPSLREFLREWRRETAKEQNVPAYVVMHDTTLDEVCRNRPNHDWRTIEDHRHWRTKGRIVRAPNSRRAEAIWRRSARHGSPTKRSPRAKKRFSLIEAGKTLDEIAVIRGRRRSTIVSMVSDLVERGLLEFDDDWVPEDRQRQIETVAANLGLETLSPDQG